MSLWKPVLSRYKSNLKVERVAKEYFLQNPSSHNPIEAAKWTQKQVESRLTHAIRLYSKLPYMVALTPHFNTVLQSHLTTLQRSRSEIPSISSPSHAHSFVKLMREEREKHDRLVEHLGAGLVEAKPYLMEFDSDVQHFIAHTLQNRMTRRLLIDQLDAVIQRESLGPVHPSANVSAIVQSVAEGVIDHARTSLGMSPRVLFSLNGSPPIDVGSIRARSLEDSWAPPGAQTKDKKGRALPTSVPCAADSLAMVLAEVLKNAARATVSFCSAAPAGEAEATRVNQNLGGLLGHEPAVLSDDLPPVRVDVFTHPLDAREVAPLLTVHVSDLGGGLQPGMQDAVFRFGFTTAQQHSQEAAHGGEAPGHAPPPHLTEHEGFATRLHDSPSHDPADLRSSPPRRGDVHDFTLGSQLSNKAALLSARIAGHGFGLPLAQSVAEMFGGRVGLKATWGVGTDVWITWGSFTDLMAGDAESGQVAPRTPDDKTSIN